MTKATKLRAAKSWIMLGFLILVSFAVILLGREQQDLFTGHVTTVPIPYMKANSEEFYEIKNIPGLSGVKVTFFHDTKNNLLTVKKDKEIPFEGKSYSLFALSWKEPAAIEQMELTLKLREEEVSRKGLNPTDLHLYVNGKELPLTQTKKDERYLYYKVTSTETGDYVIGKASRPAVTQPTTALPLPKSEAAPPAEEPPREPEPTTEPVAEEKAVQQPQLPFWQRLWDWLK